ncbi:competence protein, partial [Francisella noatunensis subsp. orientalis]|nr:competence protein [Francisella orientalis]NIB66387.1 competence protein [Francisella orientalis]NIY52973.1 competence protein [Francisella orientalis]NIY58929.1 competence protein [Francisella orientalis]
CLLVILLFVSFCPCYSYDKIEDFKYNQNILLKANKSYRHYLIPANNLELEAKVHKPHEYDNVEAFNYSEYL